MRAAPNAARKTTSGACLYSENHISESLLDQSEAFFSGLLVKNGCEADSSESPVVLEIAAEPGRVVFTVTDRGPGFAAPTLTRLGEPFFTTKPPHQGKGLGLYIVRMFAERSGGSIDFLPGPGGRVRLALPRHEEESHG